MKGTQLKNRVKAKLTQELIGTIHLLDKHSIPHKGNWTRLCLTDANAIQQ